MNNQPLLEFLIPTYKRFDGAVNAAISVASQVHANSLVGIVSVRIVDDASPGFSLMHLGQELGDFHNVISYSANGKNKGMSLNIFDMVESSNAHFCTVLTDDDWLFPGCLVEIIGYLEHLVDRSDVGGLFTPRYSYLEDGSLHCVVCQPFKHDKLLPSGPVNSLGFCHNGFILTGFVFRPSIFAKDAWMQNIQNSFFTVINFWGILSSHSILFVNRNWFHHTVLNYCHWDSWGDGNIEQRRRLYTDYMDSIAYVARQTSHMCGSTFMRLRVFIFEVNQYVYQIVGYMKTTSHVLSCKGHIVESRFAYRVSLFLGPVKAHSLRVFSFLWKPIKLLLRSLHLYIFTANS